MKREADISSRDPGLFKLKARKRINVIMIGLGLR